MAEEEKRLPIVSLPRESGEFIAKNSEDVFIDQTSIEKTASSLAKMFSDENYSLSSWKKERLHPNMATESAIDFIFTMDTLNFCFWPDDGAEKFTVDYKGHSYTGYWALVACLNRALDEGIPITSASFQCSVMDNQLRHVFRSASKGEVPLLKERLEALHDGGQVLLKKFDGSFVTCVRACEKDALKLLHVIVNNFVSFRDAAEYQGTSVGFYKRAQILIADIWSCFEGKDLGEFHNINMLTMFADYRVPQTLEYFGILRYSSVLKQLLEKHTVFEGGSRYESEIRGCSIEAVERMKTEICRILSNSGNNDELLKIVNSITVDFHLWDFARNHRKEMNHLPFHRVRTIYY